MAEVHIQTAQDFILQINSLTNSDTLYLDNDIDLQTISFSSIKNWNCNLDGQGHTIYNLQASITPFRFSNQALSIKNVGFRNILNLSTNSLFTRNGDPADRKVTFENCQFQGKTGSLSTAAFKYIRCYIELTFSDVYLTRSGYTSGRTTQIENCYFVIDITLDSTTNYRQMFETLDYMRNCYFKGTVKMGNKDLRIGSNISDCVFNFNQVGTNTLRMGSFTLSDASGVCIYNKDRITHPEANYGVGLTDAEMKNASAILTKTNNKFPIVD